MNDPKDKSRGLPPVMLEQLLEEQRRRWGEGERVAVETMLAGQLALRTDRAVVLDLIYNEIILREEAGDWPQLEEYLKRFPALSAELKIQFEVDRFLETSGNDSSADDTHR